MGNETQGYLTVKYFSSSLLHVLETGNTFMQGYILKCGLYLSRFFWKKNDRDVFNEKPSREEILAATQASDVLGACSSDFILKIVSLNLPSRNISNLNESS